MSGKKKIVLMVCTGNSCRSVMAEGLLRKALEEAGRTDVEVHSAGLGTIGGMTPTDETVAVMNETGVDVSGHRSTVLTDELIRAADLILVMEEIHRRDIMMRVPEAARKTFLLKRFARRGDEASAKGANIFDPIGSPLPVYREVFRQILDEIDRIAELI